MFDAWVDSATVRFGAAGLDHDDARSLAFVVIALIEGGFLLCRAVRSTEAMHAAGRTAVMAVQHVLAAR